MQGTELMYASNWAILELGFTYTFSSVRVSVYAISIICPSQCSLRDYWNQHIRPSVRLSVDETYNQSPSLSWVLWKHHSYYPQYTLLCILVRHAPATIIYRVIVLFVWLTYFGSLVFQFNSISKLSVNTVIVTSTHHCICWSDVLLSLSLLELLTSAMFKFYCHYAFLLK